jgi:hypothetical protein
MAHSTGLHSLRLQAAGRFTAGKAAQHHQLFLTCNNYQQAHLMHWQPAAPASYTDYIWPTCRRSHATIHALSRMLQM